MILLHPFTLQHFFNDPCQFTLHFNLRPLVFGLTPFACLRSMRLSSVYGTHGREKKLGNCALTADYVMR